MEGLKEFEEECKKLGIEILENAPENLSMKGAVIEICLDGDTSKILKISAALAGADSKAMAQYSFDLLKLHKEGRK